MKANGFKAVIIAISLVAAVGLATNVFAGKGYGKGYGNPEGRGNASNCPGYGYAGSLSEEEAAKLDTERKAFFESTSDLRRSIRQKDLELQSELAKDPIERAKAQALQKDLSALRAQLDEKRLDRRIEMKEAYPEWCGGQGRNRGRGMWGRGGCR